MPSHSQGIHSDIAARQLRQVLLLFGSALVFEQNCEKKFKPMALRNDLKSLEFFFVHQSVVAQSKLQSLLTEFYSDLFSFIETINFNFN